jgi:hypothetical protein
MQAYLSFYDQPPSAPLTNTAKQEVIKSSLEEFLQNERPGEFCEDKFFIYMMHNTVVRLDVKLFRWNFAPEGVFSTVSKSVIGCKQTRGGRLILVH